MRKKQEILITGATGFIGSNLVRRLILESFNVHIITRKTSNLWRIRDVTSKIINHNLDLENQKATEKLITKIKPSFIFHLASLGLYQGVSASPAELFNVNLLGTVNLLEAYAALSLGCFINTGSSAEYGPKQNVMKETDSCQPTTFYGASKLASTLYGVVFAQNTKNPVICLRIFSPFGPLDDAGRLISYVTVRALKNEDLRLASPDSVRDFIFIDDVVDAYLATINKAQKNIGEIFNIGSGVQRTVAAVVEQVLKITGSKSKIIWGAADKRPQDSPMWQADIQKAKSKLGWIPKHSFEQGLTKTIAWFSQNLDYYLPKYARYHS